jgi:hypothetical protein
MTRRGCCGASRVGGFAYYRAVRTVWVQYRLPISAAEPRYRLTLFFGVPSCVFPQAFDLIPPVVSGAPLRFESNMKKTSRLAGAAVKRVEQYVEIHRELTEIEKLMAIPPELGKPFAADGISFTDALEHPLLGPALIDFHDCLVWPTDDERDHCEGVGTFLLVLRFAEAGHPLRAMPLPRDLSEQIRVRAMNDRAPEIAAIMKARKRGRLREHVPGMLIAKTIHGTDTLISNVDSSVRLVLSFWGRHAPKDESKESPTSTPASNF